MDGVVEFALSIGLHVVFMVLLVLAYFLFDFLRLKYRSKKYESYNRELSTQERQYILKSIAAIDILYEAPPIFPKWYSWFLFTSAFPALGLIFFIIYLAWTALTRSAANALHADFPNAFILETAEMASVGLGLLFIPFAGLFIAGWSLYYLSGFFDKLLLFLGMKSNAYGYDEQAVKEGHIARLIHNVAAYKLLVGQPFDPQAFIVKSSVFYRQVLGWLGLATLLLGLVFTIFDLRQFTAVTPEGLFMRSSYFSKEIKQLSFSDVEGVKFRCHTHDDGKQHASYDLFLNKENIVEVKNVIDNLEGLYELDKTLRQNFVEIRPYISSNNGDEEYMLEQSCTDAVTTSENFFAVAGVFHIPEFMGEKP